MKRSPIWKLSREELQGLVSRSQSLKEILVGFFGLPCAGNSYKTLIKRLKADNIDYKGLLSFKNPFALVSTPPKKQPTDYSVILVIGSDYCPSQLKKRLLRDALLDDICQICRLSPTWNGKKLNLRLDHINGINNDHRLSNLRMVCPNCDSQLDTFCGRNRVTNKRTIKNCLDCGRVLKFGNQRCKVCSHMYLNANRPTKIQWPSDFDLIEMVKAKNKLQVSKQLGVSEMAVRKRLKKLAVQVVPG